MVSRTPLLIRFLRDETASTAVEYGLIVTFIALVIISALKPIGTRMNAKFNALANNLN